jgi:hypothetical protein
LTLALAGKIRIAGHRRSRQPFSMQEANMWYLITNRLKYMMWYRYRLYRLYKYKL